MAAVASYACTHNCTDAEYLPSCDILGGTDEWLPWHEIVEYFSYNPWIFSLLGSTMVGLTGIFPLWLIPIQDGVDLKTGENGGTLKILLSFAVGALLGDVFLHLLPEAYESEFQTRAKNNHASTPAGLWVLSAFLFFVIVEKLIATVNEEAPIIVEQQTDETLIKDMNKEKEMDNNNCITMTSTKKNNLLKKCLKSTTEVQFLEKQSSKVEFAQMLNGIKDLRKNGFKEADIMKSALASECPNDGPLVDEAKNCLKKLAKTNGFTSVISCVDSPCVRSPNNIVNRLTAWAKKFTFDLFRKFFDPKAFPGYLNLLMNFLDNFTHGLSVGGSFLISFRVGVLSTFTILVHEIPHEVGDFAILLRSGFSKWGAVRAQLITAGGGIVGALAAVSFSGSLEERTNWILPLTAGGFIHIGLVTILPDLLKETNIKESLKQFGALLLGVVIMAALIFI
ncbi:PREDICTED: LOW QUALITY PROTEIN: zinc transporter ZIP13 homolog [Atta cephalotes]|uniref:Zinc transporter ZIP13 homolog n=1 Tax=Atta cephalotes TaxID=12957 RepID=A0A158P0Q3_ATTCE|nr:PREDICTED: LOW QUALITY PROTEIN: zinc transporter ZIP13 homolog [Atta cephalotes]XP_018054233.1 PREDICTED: zinc transporter ZIP13 homolog [Atta colombica]